MISLTRPSGQTFALNSDLVERVEHLSDDPALGARVVLVDGGDFTVAEPVAEVVDRIRRHRARILELSSAAEPASTAPRHLRAVVELAHAHREGR